MTRVEETVGQPWKHASVKMPSAFNSKTPEAQPRRLIRQIFRVDREEISYLRFTLESYDGMALVGTLDPHAALIHVLTPPECVTALHELLESLREKEGLRIEPLMRPSPQSKGR